MGAEVAWYYFTHDSEYEVCAFTIGKEYIKKDRLLNLPVVPFEDVEIASPDASPEQIIRSKEGMNVIYSVLRGSNDDCLQAFALNRFKGLTYEEIAEEMSISRSMVQKHISCVLAQLRKKFDRYMKNE